MFKIFYVKFSNILFVNVKDIENFVIKNYLY